MTGDTLRSAIAKATSLTNPRLSEVDWDDVAAAASGPLVAAIHSLPVERIEAGGPVGHFDDDDQYVEVVNRGDVLSAIGSDR